MSLQRNHTVWLIVFLCLCITMQVLGAPMSLWAVDGSFNDVETEGFSVPSILRDIAIVFPRSSRPERASDWIHRLLDRVPLRPPLLTR